MASGKAQTIVVCGNMGEVPFAGMAWQVLHHLEGFRRLGHEVFYVEDSGTWPYDPDENRVASHSSYAAKFIARMLDWCGLEGRWALVSAPENGRVFGMGGEDLARLYERADILVNLTGSTPLHGPRLGVPVRVYLETDPVLLQIQMAKGDADAVAFFNAHTHHVTYGVNIGRADCPVPPGPSRYIPTRPPVILDWWRNTREPGPCFTSVGNWRQNGKDIAWNGETYTWSKHHGFLKLIDAPSRIAGCLELALSHIGADEIALLKSHGWRVTDSFELSRDIIPYRDYVQASRGEFTVVKDQYARLKSGWFSDRSVCYLAAGRPVITQDTGFGTVLPVGEGLFAFDSMDDIVAAVAAVDADYARHSRAASALARDYFRAETVLAKMLEDIGAG